MGKRDRLIGLSMKVLLILSVVVLMMPASVFGADTGKMTEAGTPRNQTFIADMNGGITNPNNFNPYIPGSINTDVMLAFNFAHLWEIDTQTGKQYPEIAAEMPKALDNTMKKFRFKIRKGLKWSDGVDFTARDIEYTGKMLRDNTGLARSASFTTLIKSMVAVDNYTVEVETLNPEPRLSQKLGVVIYNNFFEPVPKHVFEKENPNTFEYKNPLTLSAYRLIKRDSQGAWLLYEKRGDWRNTLEGQIVGNPAPKYVLQRFYGLEEKRVMAATNHSLDIIMNLSPESWKNLNGKVDTIRAWYPAFPYGTFEDPGNRAICFNNQKAPYDKAEVRWALALALDVKNTSLNSYDGMQGITPLNIPYVHSLQKNYTKALLPWFKTFALADGFKPFDENVAVDITKMLQQQGVSGLPNTENAQKDTFGYGWWRYDPDEASKLLEKNGFSKKNGAWYLPDGKPWQITITQPNFNIHFNRIAYAVAEEWKKFGIDAAVSLQDTATGFNALSVGQFDVSIWVYLGTINDLTSSFMVFHSRYFKPIGSPTAGDYSRWKNAKADAIIESMEKLSPDDPKLLDATTSFFKLFVQESPVVPLFGGTFIVPTDSYYWTGYPTAENNYAGPWWWWPQFKYIVPHLKPTGR